MTTQYASQTDHCIHDVQPTSCAGTVRRADLCRQSSLTIHRFVGSAQMVAILLAGSMIAYTVTGCSSVPNRATTLTDRITGKVIADPDEDAMTDANDGVRGVITASHPASDRDKQKTSVAAAEKRTEKEDPAPQKDGRQSPDEGVITQVSDSRDAQKASSEQGDSARSDRVAPAVPVVTDSPFLKRISESGSLTDTSRRPSVNFPPISHSVGGCSDQPSLSQINADLISELTRRIDDLEDEVRTSQRTVGRLTDALLDEKKNREELEKRMRHWESEISRLERTMWQQQESDIASLTEITTLLQQLTQKHVPQQSTEAADDVPSPR